MTLRDLAREMDIHVAHLSRIETGKRPPTERIALACDRVFPERDGWFLEYYEELQGWAEVPATFRDWSEYEEKAATLHIWQPSIVEGLLQTKEYARVLIEKFPGTPPQLAHDRLWSRMERQRRVLFRDDPPRIVFVVDEAALYRRVGSAEIMAAQIRHLIEVAALPHVTLQIMPAIEHCLNSSSMVVADEKTAYLEHAASGYVFTDEPTVSRLSMRLDTLRGECYRVSETMAILERLYERWSTGASPLTATGMGGSA
jgi:transcriptional regulator with XRE-family HTH domain